MKTFSISGASDDLIETNGIEGCDEFNIIEEGIYQTMLTIVAASGTLDIHCIYNGYWAFAIGSSDGDCDKQPPWPMRRIWGKYAPYSEVVEIECPDDARLTGELVDKADRISRMEDAPDG